MSVNVCLSLDARTKTKTKSRTKTRSDVGGWNTVSHSHAQTRPRFSSKSIRAQSIIMDGHPCISVPQKGEIVKLLITTTISIILTNWRP